MKKIYMLKTRAGGIPFLEFLQRLEPKQRSKLIEGIACLVSVPGYMTEPAVKHFTLEKYKRLYEYRARIRILIRVIFTLDEEGSVILLYPFIKRHERDTMQALERALRVLKTLSPDRLHEYVPQI